MPFRQPVPLACPFRVEQDPMRGPGVSTRRGPCTTDGRPTRGSRAPERCDDRKRRGSDGGGGKRTLGGPPATTAGTSPRGTNRNATRHEGKKRGAPPRAAEPPPAPPRSIPLLWGRSPFPRGCQSPFLGVADVQPRGVVQVPSKRPGAGRPQTHRERRASTPRNTAAGSRRISAPTPPKSAGDGGEQGRGGRGGQRQAAEHTTEDRPQAAEPTQRRETEWAQFTACEPKSEPPNPHNGD